MERVEFYVADLQALRFILIVGGLLLFAWWSAQLAVERKDKPKTTPYELCSLHKMATHECRDQHDAPD